MAEKDDDFLDGDEVGAVDAKEGSKGRPKFASAMLMQILKWVAIVVGAILFIITVVVITINIMGVGKEDKTRIEESPEYAAVVPVLSWYGEVKELRGTTNDDVRRTYVVSPQLGYTDNAAVVNELILKKVQITDMLLSWFSGNKADYLRDIRNREQIRETLKAEINKMMTLSIDDVRFTSYQVLEF